MAAALGVVFFGVLEGIRSRSRYRSWLLRRNGGLPARSSAESPPSTPGTASTLSRASADPRRRGVSLGGAAVLRQRQRVPPGDPPTGPQLGCPLGRCAVPSDHRHRRHRRRHAQATRQRTQRSWHPPDVRGAAQPPARPRNTLGLLGKLDRKHFYDSMDEALTDIVGSDTP